MTETTINYPTVYSQHPIPERLDPGVFDVPVTDIRIGYRSAVYFSRAGWIAQNTKPDTIVTMQVFQKNTGILCGMDEVLAILKTCSGYYEDYDLAKQLFTLLLNKRRALREERPGIWHPGHHGITADISAKQAYKSNLMEMADLEMKLDNLWHPASWGDQLQVKALYDGSRITPWEPVLTITGPYHLFAHLESVYLGILARQTKIASNTSLVTRAAAPKPVLFFADRFDHYATQGGDGYAAKVGGATGFASDAMTAWWGDRATGTMPHALIALYEGNVCDASEAFQRFYPDTHLISLVDFNNDSVSDAVNCLRRFGEELWGVRLDTSERMVDRSITEDDMGAAPITGVNPTLVHKVRAALNSNGGAHVKIIVSGGFNADKIAQFERDQVPVDVYAVGSSLLKGSNDFTADIVKPWAKRGRWARSDRRLAVVE
jgi:nicotinate phosphoribosyltransferase